MKPKTKEAGVLVLVAEDSLGDIDTVVNALRKKGLRVTNVLEAAGGIVTGLVAADRVDALRQVPGVENVLPDEERTLAGPGAPTA